MAPSPSKLNGNNDKDVKEAAKALLTLIPDPSEDELTADNSVVFSLRSTPAEEASPKYKTSVRVLKGSEQVRPMLNWYQGVNKVLTGLNVTDYNGAINLASTMMKGTPHSVFKTQLRNQREMRMKIRIQNEADDQQKQAIKNQGIDHADNQEFPDVDTSLRQVLTALLPRKVLARVKRFLRRSCRKPGWMKVRDYVQHLYRINSDEIPLLPPFNANQHLQQDELLDIILFGTPRGWQREMDRQGFDPMDNTLDEVVSFMENIESAEEFDNDKNTNKNNKKDTKKKASKSDGGSSPSNGNGNKKTTKYCIVHGHCNHTTEECRTIQSEAKRVKTNNGNGGKQQVNSEKIKDKNKTWSRKAEEAKKATEKDMAAFVQKEVAKTYMKMVKAHKKRKNDEDSDDELAAFDLADFNYEDMENLKIDDDTVVSV